MAAASLHETLAKYIPLESVDIVAEWIVKHKIKVKITRTRQTKVGDYRHPFNGKGHQITINHDLNKYAFLITFTHEVAHLKTWLIHQNKVSPHGNEWKHEFKLLLHPLIHHSIFPQDVIHALRNYVANPAASSCTDLSLARTLKNYDKDAEELVHVENIPMKGLFMFDNGSIFRKDTKLRKNYKCTELKTGKIYLVNPIAKVTPVKEDENITDSQIEEEIAIEEKENDGLIKVENIPYRSLFSFDNGLVLRKDEKLRKRFKCTEVKTGKIYSVHPNAKVKLVKPE